MITISIDREILVKYKVDNPEKKEFPTSACKLNPDHPFVKKFSKKLDK